MFLPYKAKLKLTGKVTKQSDFEVYEYCNMSNISFSNMSIHVL